MVSSPHPTMTTRPDEAAKVISVTAAVNMNLPRRLGAADRGHCSLARLTLSGNCVNSLAGGDQCFTLIKQGKRCSHADSDRCPLRDANSHRMLREP
jgi:hypothetical protein